MKLDKFDIYIIDILYHPQDNKKTVSFCCNTYISKFIFNSITLEITELSNKGKNKVVPDLLQLSEEDLFMYSTVHDCSLPVKACVAIQNFFIYDDFVYRGYYNIEY